jgi:steroid delta-isomerase-like uncharacterized protein
LKTKTPLETSRDGIAAWNARDGEAVTAPYTDETIFIHPPGNLKGKAAIRKFLEGVWAAYPDSKVESVNLGEIGPGLVASEWMMHGTNTGTLVDGTPATGKTINLPGVTLTQFQGDKVVSDRTYFDLHNAFEQLGVA